MICIYDPEPTKHDYLTTMFFRPMLQYAHRNNVEMRSVSSLRDARGTLCCLADYLTQDAINTIKTSGAKIVGFSVTDSSYISQCCRPGSQMSQVDLFFLLSGIQKVNHGYETIVKDGKIALERRQFLPEEDWAVFDSMRKAGRLQSLPYVHWHNIPLVGHRSYDQRSQKVLIRGGHHMRRFILALKLAQLDLLDVNSGFHTAPYFRDDMNPQFRYCEDCRRKWKDTSYGVPLVRSYHCTNDRGDLNDLGAWNNKCPASFRDAAIHIGLWSDAGIELLSKPWLRADDHQALLARITFTSDLKWLFSIYAAQRFWDAAAAGCINVLPLRTSDQEYFPAMKEGEHYKTYSEILGPDQLRFDFSLRDEIEYLCISANAFALYMKWIRATDYALNTNLIEHILKTIEQQTS